MAETGTCKHGKFDLMGGCPQCIADGMGREGNTEASIAEEIDKTNQRKDFEESQHPDTLLSIVKVQYYSTTTEELSPREYTYYSVERLAVGDIVTVPVRDTTGKAKVSVIDVPASEVRAFKDKVKTIRAGSIIPKVTPEQENMEEGLNSEGLTLLDTTINLCDTCNQQLPECFHDHEKIKFGDGIGNDNVIECDGYSSSEEGSEPDTAFPNSEFDEAVTAVIKVDPGKAPSFAKHLEQANRILEIASAREILNENDAKGANDDSIVMSELKKAVTAERRSFTDPLNEYLKSINEAYKVITDPLTEADEITRKLLTAYKVAQQKKAAEVEALNREAEELARKQAAANNGEFTVDTKQVAVPFAPKLTRTASGKSGLVDNWKYEIIDIDQLPREYMVPDKDMLTSIAVKQHDAKPVKGVRFFNDPGLRVSR